jgi:serine/threonine protein kinase
MPISAGDKLGPYEILSPIGAGGMGEVWKARDTRLDRIVAIKTSSESFGERFEREARAIAALNHPHICQIYDVGPDYIVMEYIDGTEIKGPLPLDLALKAAIQLASALEAAHRKSITHRDLKPANILSTKSGIKVLDFGLAKFQFAKESVSDETITRALTQEGSIVGTLQYMAPEQLQGKPTDARSDIFSFGCVLYEIVTGQRAFRAENKASLIASILERQPEALTSHQPQIPPALDRVVRKCLAKDPDDRWQTATDLKSELQWVQEGGSQAGMPAPLVEHPRGSARLGWIVAGALAAALGAFAIFYFRTAPPPPVVTRFEVPLPEGTSWGGPVPPLLSPDGSRILLSATHRDGTRSLWLRRMDSVVPQLIPGISDTTGAAWSPDGLSIVYTANRALWRLDLSGGSPQPLSSQPMVGPPAWSTAGIVLFTDLRNSIYQIPASGGEPKLAMPAGGSQWSPHVLPDGRHFLFADGSRGGLYLAELGAKEGKRLADGSAGQFVEPSWVLNVRGTSLVAQSFDAGSQSLSGSPITIADQVASSLSHGGLFSVSSSGVLAYRRTVPPALNDLTWFDRRGKQLGTVGERALYSNPALSPDGRRLAVGRMDPALNTRDIWVLDLARGVSSRLTFDPADERNPTWSPDGTRIAYSKSNSQGDTEIAWKAAGGAGAEESFLESSEVHNLEDWSPDGKSLLFNANNLLIAKLPLDGTRQPSPVLKASFPQINAHLSPDGRWLAYVSQETGRSEIFVQNFPPAGDKWQISSDGGDEPSWRRDGKEIYFLEGRRKLKAVAVKADGASLEVGTAQDLFEVPLDNARRRNHYVATPDGQRFLFVTTPKDTALDTTPFVVVQNWQTALTR